MTGCEHEWESWSEIHPLRPSPANPTFVRTWARTCPHCRLSEIRPVPPGDVPSDGDPTVVGPLIPLE